MHLAQIKFSTYSRSRGEGLILSGYFTDGGVFISADGQGSVQIRSATGAASFAPDSGVDALIYVAGNHFAIVTASGVFLFLQAASLLNAYYPIGYGK
jgi:hypothetical protein